jgi:hypothetical protein
MSKPALEACRARTISQLPPLTITTEELKQFVAQHEEALKKDGLPLLGIEVLSDQAPLYCMMFHLTREMTPVEMTTACERMFQLANDTYPRGILFGNGYRVVPAQTPRVV